MYSAYSAPYKTFLTVAQTTGILCILQHMGCKVLLLLFSIKGHTGDFALIKQEEHLLKMLIYHFQWK